MSLRRSWWIALGWLALGSCLSNPVARGAVVFSTLLDDASLNRLERELLHDGHDGTLEEHDLLTAALVASGVRDEGSLSRYRRQVRLWSHRLYDQVRDQTDPLKRARLIVEFLHDQVFRGEYRAVESDLRETIDRGDYDCLTAAILFRWLDESIGGNASIQYQPAHVNVRIQVNGQDWIVEPTCRTSLPRLSAGKSMVTHNLHDTSVVALMYYNQGVNQIERGDFASAADSNLKALRLFAGHSDARRNLLAAWNNWAVECHAGGDTSRAAQLLQLILTIAPESAQARRNLQSITAPKARP